MRYLNDRLTALSSNYPGKNLVEILQQYYYQTDMLKYVSQFDFPLDYVGPEYHVCFRDTTLLQRAVEMGYHVAPGPWATRAAGTCAVSSSRTRRSS